MADASLHGTMVWTDLTVPDAVTVRDFYAAVCGWRSEGVDMGGYEDFTMFVPGREAPVAGICHARGPNAGQPAQWMHYVQVPSLETALAACTARGGAVVVPVRSLGAYGSMAVIRDPAGAVLALLEPPQ